MAPSWLFGIAFLSAMGTLGAAFTCFVLALLPDRDLREAGITSTIGGLVEVRPWAVAVVPFALCFPAGILAAAMGLGEYLPGLPLVLGVAWAIPLQIVRWLSILERKAHL